MGHNTWGSCSGMTKDGHGARKNPCWICFIEPFKTVRNLKAYFHFLADCLLDAGRFVEYIYGPPNGDFTSFNGYLPVGLNEALIEVRLKALTTILKRNDFFRGKNQPLVYLEII